MFAAVQDAPRAMSPRIALGSRFPKCESSEITDHLDPRSPDFPAFRARCQPRTSSFVSPHFGRCRIMRTADHKMAAMSLAIPARSMLKNPISGQLQLT